MSNVRKPGILFLEALPTIAGGQAVLLNLIPALTENFRVAVLLPSEGPLAEALRSRGIECFVAPMGRYSLMQKSLRDVLTYGARLPLMVRRTMQLIRRWRADLIYANSGPVIVWGALAAQLSGKPMIWHHHNLLADGKTLRLVRLVARLPAVRRVICVSEAARAQLTSLQAKSIVIQNGVDTQRFLPDPAERIRIRNELGIPLAAPVIGMVGDLIHLKRQDTLLSAIPTLLAELPDLYTVLVGGVRPGDQQSEDYADNLRAKARMHVCMIGRRDDLSAVLNAFDLLVVASERETGPLVLLEALACAVPVISTPVGIAPDLLPSEALFSVGDVSGLAALLHVWMTDPKRLRSSGEAARLLVEENLSLTRFQKSVSAEIEGVLMAG